MIVPSKHHKIEKAVDTSGARRNLAHPFVEMDGEQAWLIATDSYQLVVAIPVELEKGDTPGTVPLEAIAGARRRTSDQRIALNGGAVVKGLVEFKDGEATYARPDAPSQGLLKHARPEGTPVVEFGVNVKVLLAAAQGLGSDSIRVAVYDPLKAIIVRPLNAAQGPVAVVGAVMPIRLRDKEDPS